MVNPWWNIILSEEQLLPKSPEYSVKTSQENCSSAYIQFRIFSFFPTYIISVCITPLFYFEGNYELTTLPMVLNIYLNPRVLETTFSNLTWKWTLSSLMILIFFSTSYGAWNRSWSFQDVFSWNQADNWHEKARNVCAEVQSMRKKEKGLT